MSFRKKQVKAALDEMVRKGYLETCIKNGEISHWQAMSLNSPATADIPRLSATTKLLRLSMTGL